ncbi:MAG TPA: nuclear transport factor 2 family protein [Gemmatimonadales bacterium]|nr:nuclear transport factor 2 family protein [Gemmatimonadales bacterium]
METAHRIGRLAFAVFIALPGCAPKHHEDETASTAAVNEIWKEYSASLNAGDLDRWLALWTEDGVQMPPDEPVVVGKERIRARNRAVLDRFAFDIGITNQEVRTAGDLAVARGTYTATLTPKQGGGGIPIDGKFMTILVRQPDGGWKIHRDIFNSNVPAGK